MTLATKDVAYLFGSVQDFEKQERAPKAIYNAAAWQCDDALGSTWGYTQGMSVRSAESVAHELIEIISLGGNLLLNISPEGDGSIPADQQQELVLGEWLAAHGEAIYGQSHGFVGGGATNFPRIAWRLERRLDRPTWAKGRPKATTPAK